MMRFGWAVVEWDDDPKTFREVRWESSVIDAVRNLRWQSLEVVWPTVLVESAPLEGVKGATVRRVRGMAAPMAEVEWR